MGNVHPNYSDIAVAAQEATAPQGGRVLWKTTTQGKKQPVPRDFDEEALAVFAGAPGWGINDAWAITQALHKQPQSEFFYYDDLHFKPIVSEETNMFFLNQIC